MFYFDDWGLDDLDLNIQETGENCGDAQCGEEDIVAESSAESTVDANDASIVDANDAADPKFGGGKDFTNCIPGCTCREFNPGWRSYDNIRSTSECSTCGHRECEHFVRL